VRDSVLDGETGVLFEGQTVAEVCAGIERFEALSFAASALKDNARRFDPARFQAEFGALIECASS
jgi:hypothetical protein